MLHKVSGVKVVFDKNCIKHNRKASIEVKNLQEGIKMKETKTLEFFDEYDFENQNNQERTDVHQLLGGEIWYN